MLQNRRNFIKTTSLGISAALLSQYIYSCQNSTTGESPLHNIGVQLFSIRDYIATDPKTTLEHLAKIGYKHVETFGLENDKFWKLSVHELKKLLQDNGLKTYSGHYDLEKYLSKEHSDKENLERYIEIAHELGQEYIIAPVPPMFNLNALEVEDYQYAADQLNKAGEMAKKAGIKMGYHNHFWEFRNFANGTRGLDILIAFTEPDLVDFELDIFWIEKAGYRAQSYFEKYPGRFSLWHIKDMDRSYTDIVVGENYDDMDLEDIMKNIRYSEVGSGAIDYKNITNYAEKSGLKYAFVEQDDIYIDDKLASLKKSYEYVTKHLTR